MIPLFFTWLRRGPFMANPPSPTPMNSHAETTLTFATHVATPLGEILLLGDRTALYGVYFKDQRYYPVADPSWRWDPKPFGTTRRQLRDFFKRPHDGFTAVLKPRGTPFQQKVWSALSNIPLGQTATYSEIAVAIGKPNAKRAVGAAIGRNPISILIPCHRVVRNDGALSGYRWGVERKRALLEREKVR